VEGGFVRDYNWGKKFPALKAPRQYPLVLLVEGGWRENKALGSELAFLSSKNRKEVEQSLHSIRSEFCN
jgi:hypothetical protein